MDCLALLMLLSSLYFTPRVVWFGCIKIAWVSLWMAQLSWLNISRLPGEVSVVESFFLYGIHWFKLGDFALRVSSGLEIVVIFRFLYKSLLHFSFLAECILSIEPIFGYSCHPDWPVFTNPHKGVRLVCEGSGKTGKPWISFLWGVLEGGAASMCVSMVMALRDTLTTHQALKLIVWERFVFSIFCDYGLIVAWFSRVSPRLCCACID